MGIEDWKNGGFGLYLHWPFCQAKCPYCDFNSHVSNTIDQNRWRAAYLSEIRRYGVETQGRQLDTVFFGGGTPSLMDPDVVHAILEEIRLTWPTSNSFEVTLEANPGSVESGRFAAYRDAGVNRISMGVQALNDVDLKRLGRLHNVAEAMKAFDTARNLFDRVSFDLIYARQDQTLVEWKSELKQALNIAIDHLSLYQLTVEEGTAFGARHAIGRLSGLPPDDLSAEMYFATQEICDAAGLPAYEVSNHARDMAESRHNLIYWRYGDYVGIGPGAHGRITTDGRRFAVDTKLTPSEWLEQVEQTGSGTLTRQHLSDENQAVEYLMMSLRLREGSSLSRFQRLNGHGISEEKLIWLEEEDLIMRSGDQIRTSQKGRPILNAILRELLA